MNDTLTKKLTIESFAEYDKMDTVKRKAIEDKLSKSRQLAKYRKINNKKIKTYLMKTKKNKKMKVIDNKQEVKELLEYQLGDIRKGIEVHKKYNQPYDPLGDSFTEMLHACMYGTLCMGSGGSGWDSYDKGESKYSNRLQSRKCNSCPTWDGRVNKNGKKIWNYKKVMFFNTECPYCGSTDLGKYPKDSRFGIASKSHLDYIDEMKGYRLTLLEPETFDPDCRVFRLRSWFIETKDEYLTEYATRQFNSPKSNGVNFLPIGQDFYRSSPCLHLDASISEDGVKIIYYDTENKVVDKGPDKFYVKSMKEIMDKKSFGKERGKLAR